MSKQLDDVDQDYFWKIITVIERHRDWVFDTEFGTTVSEAVELAITGSGPVVGELQYRHPETNGRLYLRLPSVERPNGAMKALLEQPLDPKLDQINTELVEKLGDAHRRIAEKHSTPYITVQSDAFTILSIDVPVDYNRDDLVYALDAASTISVRVKDLHTGITETIEES